jgi:hypothetical protein
MSGTAIASRLALAYAEGEAATYLKAYKEVLGQLEEQKATHLLVSVVNTLLKRMAVKGETAYLAGKGLMAEMAAQRSKMFVMAAMVDITLNERKAGEVVTAVGGMKETLGRE